MDRIPLPQGYEATRREATIYKPQRRPDTHVIGLRTSEVEPTMKPPISTEPGNSGLVIQHSHH